MQKKLLAVAVAGALGAPAVALAQASTVQVYGTINIEYAWSNQGNNNHKVDATNRPGSNIGFKGEEKLGGGLSAWFQCESTADIGGQRNGASNGTFCTRNSAVGLKGAFGNVFMGTWDTPFKRTMAPNLVGANQTGHWGAAMIVAGASTTVHDGSNPAVFMRRQRNSINYDTPNFGGFQAHLAMSSTNNSTNVAGNLNKARVLSLGASFRTGGLYVSGGYEQHNEFGMVGLVKRDADGWHIGANYTFMGKVKVGGFYTQQSFDAAIGDVEYDAWHIGVDWNIAGPHSILASYSTVDDADGVLGQAGPGNPRPAAGPNTGAKFWQIRYKHALSKRTNVFVGYSKLNNEANAAYNINLLSAPLPGRNQRSLGINLQHRF
jgi:predicted porin